MSVAKKIATAAVVGALALACVSAVAPNASAFNLRAPQVGFNNAGLQGYLNGIGESINTLTDQLDAQTWQSSVSGNTTFTLQIELSGSAAGNSIGVYNAGAAVPGLYQLFPGAAQAGWFVTCHFASTGQLVVYLFDDNGVLQGSINYAGVDRTNFGFYLSGPGGTFYSQDYRNGGAAQVLTYVGTGQNYGDWWECFEDSPRAAGDQDYDDCVLLLQSVAPTPARTASWGGLKALYR